MIAILEPRCYDGDTRKFKFNDNNPTQMENFESWVSCLNDNGCHNYIVYWVTEEEYNNHIFKERN